MWLLPKVWRLFGSEEEQVLLSERVLTVSGKVFSLVVYKLLNSVNIFFPRGEIAGNGSSVGEVHLLFSNWNVLTHGAVSTRQDKAHFKPITAAECSLTRAWRGERNLFPLCANSIIPLIAGLQAARREKGDCWVGIKLSPHICTTSTKPENLFLKLWVRILWYFLKYAQKACCFERKVQFRKFQKGKSNTVAFAITPLLPSISQYITENWRQAYDMYIKRKLSLWWMMAGRGQ